MVNQIFQNPYDSRVRETVRQNRQKSLNSKVTTLFAHKKFYERWHFFSVGCIILTYLCNIFSPLCAMAVVFFAMHDSLLPLLGVVIAGGISAAMAMVVVVVLEILKRYSAKNALVYIFNYKKINLGFFIAVVCSAASIITSFYGAKTIPQRFTNPPTAQIPPIEDLGQISKEFDGLILDKKKQIEDTKTQISQYKKDHTSTRTGKITSNNKVRGLYADLNSNLGTLQSNLSSLQTQKIEAITAGKSANTANATTAKTEHTTAITAHHAKVDSDGLFLGYVTLILEVVFWLCFTFMIFYYKRCEIEFSSITPTPIAQTPPAAKNTTANQRTKPNQTTNAIGFFNGSNQLYNGFKLVDSDGVRCIEYNGKLYNKDSIKNNIYANKTKIKKYASLGDDLKADRYAEHLKRWCKFLEVVQTVP
jgi:hypothetical protein